MIKFLQIMGRVDNSSYIEFEFEEHDRDEVIVGDQIWSDGHCIHIADFVEPNELNYLIQRVENRTAFKGALRRMELRG